jgi:hypothetical protein
MRRQGARSIAMLLGAIVLFGLGSTAHALSTTIGGASCATCFGSVYTLDVAHGGGNLWNVTYTVNTSGYTGAGSGLDAIAFKIANETNILGVSVTSQPLSFTGTPLPIGSLAAGGCNGGSTGGFICSSSSNAGGLTVPNGTYQFKYGVNLAAGSLFGSVTDWSIKALYVNSSGDARGLTSENGVPVPGTSILFGLGFALFVGWRQHYSRRRQNISSID